MRHARHAFPNTETLSIAIQFLVYYYATGERLVFVSRQDKGKGVDCDMSGTIAFAGSVIVDKIKTIDVWPQKGTIAQILGETRAIGGSVANTGIDLKRLDPSVDVRVFADVGTDELGDYALQALSSEDLDVSGACRVRAVTTNTDVMTVSTTGERTFFTNRGAGALFDPIDDRIATLKGDIFHLGYILLLDALDSPDPEYGTKAARLLAKVRAMGIRTSLDLVSEQSERVPRTVKPVLAQCDYAVINEIEAEAITGVRARNADGSITADRLEALSRAVAACGVRDRTVVHCPEGSGAVDKDGRFAYLPSLVLPAGWIKGSVGAGDAFCSGMLYSFLRDWDIERGMRLARAAAAMNLASSSGTGGAKSLDETLELEKQIGDKQCS